MFAHRVILTIVVSVIALMTSVVLDRLLAPLAVLPQFLIQVPIVVLIIDEFRRIILKEAPAYGLTPDDVNGTFFFAAPMAAFGAVTLFRDLRLIHRGV
jgi:hypothetical protein